MLLVKTVLKASPIHGLGVFAAEHIIAGTVVWTFREGFDFRVSEESVAALPEIARDKLLHYSAKWGGGYVISADDARFLNHSTDANLRTMDDPDCDIAIRDIEIGEELLEDYREFDDTFAGRPIDRQISQAAPEKAHPPAFTLSELKSAILETISDESDATKAPLKIYRCDDCGCRIAAQILSVPTEPMPHYYLAAGGGDAFIGNCPICGGTGIHELIPDQGPAQTEEKR